MSVTAVIPALSMLWCMPQQKVLCSGSLCCILLCCLQHNLQCDLPMIPSQHSHADSATLHAVGASLSLSGLLDTALQQPHSSEQTKTTRSVPSCSALCIGLGAGTLPNFLSHHFPGMQVKAVELDPVVIQAATEAMGLPADRYVGGKGYFEPVNQLQPAFASSPIGNMTYQGVGGS